MNRILGHVTESLGRFQPVTPQDFFALQLARKLEDVGHLRDYLVLVQHHPTEILIRSYRRAVKRGNGNPSERFRFELNRLTTAEEQ